MRSSDDRRKRKRMALRWPLRLSRRPGKWSRREHDGKSQQRGIIFVTKKPFKPGERLQCEMVIPGESFGSAEASLRLKCFVTVRRVEYLHGGSDSVATFPKHGQEEFRPGTTSLDATDH